MEMSTEPPHKKLKLSSTDEPLTQHDVISFQKEALYRCMNEKRVSLGAIAEQYEISKKNYIDISTKLSNLMALIITLANFLKVICKERSNSEDENICSKMATGDESEVIQLSDSFMRVLTKYVNAATVEVSAPDNDRLSNLSLELKQLQQTKKELFYKNNELMEEINGMKKYYEDLIKKYDREESQTVKRVFKKELEDGEKEEEDNGQKLEIKEQQTVKSEEINKEAIPVEPTKEGEIVSNDNDKENEIAQKKLIAEYEIRATDLQNEIKELKLVVDELEKFKSSNEEKITNLEKKLSPSAENGVVFNSSSASTTDLESLNIRLFQLNKENNELRLQNDSFLGKFQNLSSEREVFNNKITDAFKTNLQILQQQNLSLEKDLVRIRTARDDLLSKVSILESETKTPVIFDDLKKAIDLSNEQWTKFESRPESTSKDLLLAEIQGMEKAFKDLTNINNQKYSELINQESIIAKLKVEKTKADQKYFAAMRSKDSILIENKNLTKTISKSNELILQLKDSEKLLQQKIENLYKQLQLSQNNEKRLIDSNKSESLMIINLNSQINKVEKRSNILKTENLHLISELNRLKTVNHGLETDKKTVALKNGGLTDKCDQLHKKLSSFTGKTEDKKKTHNGLEDDDSLHQELENFRTLVYCSLCSKNWKTVAIKTCGHVFCENCVKERLAARMRKCPTCNYPFSSNDILPIHL